MKKLCGDDLIYMVSQNILRLGISQKDGETLVLALLDNEANVRYIFNVETAMESSNMESLDSVIDQDGKILSDVNLEVEAIVNYIKNSDDETWISILAEPKGLMLFASKYAIFTEVMQKVKVISTLVSFARGTIIDNHSVNKLLHGIFDSDLIKDCFKYKINIKIQTSTLSCPNLITCSSHRNLQNIRSGIVQLSKKFCIDFFKNNSV